MKRFTVILLTIATALTLLSGCKKSVYEEFQQYRNIDTAVVGKKYEQIIKRLSVWVNYKEDAGIKTSIKKELLPLLDDSLEILKEIKPETEEVRELNDKYIKVTETFKEGVTKVLDGLEEKDTDKISAGNGIISNGIALYKEYNEALDALADEVGAAVEY